MSGYPLSRRALTTEGVCFVTSVRACRRTAGGRLGRAGGPGRPGIGRRAGPGCRARPARPQPASSRLLLINGARAAAGADGGGPVVFPVGRGLAGAVQVVRLGSRALVIPVAAVPFVGRGLSPGLFEPGALARAERGGRLPVTLRFRDRLHAPPGVTVTRTGKGTAQGYLTAAGARSSARHWPASSAPTMTTAATAPTGCSPVAFHSPLRARPPRPRPPGRPFRCTP